MQSARRNQAQIETGHVAALDGVRGIAVLYVFVLHFGGGAQSPNWLVRTAGETIKMGWSGVTLFFVLSGFLITGILWKSRGTTHWWRNFYTRRCLRIFPLYYLSLLLVLAVSLFRHTTWELGPSFVVFGFYLQNFPFPTKVHELTGIWVTHFWSLAVEEHFYFFWPFLLVAMPSLRRARQMCVAIFLLSMASRLWISLLGAAGFEGLYSSTPARVGELSVGAWLALAVGEHPEWVAKMRRMALPVLFGSLGAVVIYVAITGDFSARQQAGYLFVLPAFSFAAAALIVLALEQGAWSRLVSLPLLRHLGVISYGIYVYHVLFRDFYASVVTRLAPNLSKDAQLVVVFFVAAGLTLFIAEISYNFLERPLLGLKERFAPRVRAASTIPESIRN